ncbi:MAG: hypothetical protein QOJ56_5585 [Mycobacterium sp.]|jgi:WD40 repeat protein|nr:hypothetical protein [Mycobacterium sp.]
MTSEIYCLRCDKVKLVLLPESDRNIYFYHCPQCRRQFARRPGQALTERWLGPLSLVLYGVIFSRQPQDEADRTVAMLRDQKNAEMLAAMEKEIRLELTSPTQNVRDILDLKASERDLREFLELVADKLREELQEFPLIRSLQGHQGKVHSLAISSDGELLVSGGSDGVVMFWNLQTGELLRTLAEAAGAVFSVALSPDGQTIASGGADEVIHLWDRQTGVLKQTLRGHTGKVCSVVFAPDGAFLASGSADTTIRLWNVRTGQPPDILRGHSHTVYCVAISPDGKRLVSGSSGNTLCVWDLATKKLQRALQEHGNAIQCLAFQKTTTLASGSLDATIKRWDLDAPSGHAGHSPDGPPWGREPAHEGAVRSLLFDPTRRVLISGGDDKTIRLWNAHSGHALRTFSGHGGPVYSLAISPDGKTLASCSQRIKLWRMR